jgi:hypothetical protein
VNYVQGADIHHLRVLLFVKIVYIRQQVPMVRFQAMLVQFVIRDIMDLRLQFRAKFAPSALVQVVLVELLVLLFEKDILEYLMMLLLFALLKMLA